MSILSYDFYNRNTLEVAKSLLGCKLCRSFNNQILSGIIVETEAYTQNDPACHAYRGKTPRAITLFGKPGKAYVYFIYGMYYCFNVVTEQEGTAGAVLIRALEPISPVKNTNGPGKLCRELNITKEFNAAELNEGSGLWIEEGRVEESNIVSATRIGIKQAIDYPWRFFLKDNIYVSKKSS